VVSFALTVLMPGNNPGTNWTGVWLAPTANVRFCRRRKISCLC